MGDPENTTGIFFFLLIKYNLMLSDLAAVGFDMDFLTPQKWCSLNSSRLELWFEDFSVRVSKASSAHNYYIVPFRTGVQPDVLHSSTGQPFPKPLTSQSFSICQQTVFPFLLWFPLTVCVVQRTFGCRSRRFSAIKYQWKSLCLHVADFPAQLSSSLSPKGGVSFPPAAINASGMRSSSSFHLLQ